MNCTCCSKEVFDSPEKKYLYDADGNILKQKVAIYSPELNTFLETELPSVQYSLPKNFTITLTDPYFSYIKKNFCEECYTFIIKDKIEELLRFLANFNSKEEKNE